MNATVLFVSGAVDACTAPQLGVALACADYHADPVLVVDLTAVDFLSASGIGLLHHAHHELGHLTRLVIVAEGPRTVRPLQLVGTAGAVDVYPTLDEALTAASVYTPFGELPVSEPHYECR